jgi:hypothetical protein
MVLEAGIDVLKNPRNSDTSHIAICFTFQIICDAPGDLLCQASVSGGLKKRKIVKFVIFIVDDGVTVHTRMLLEPGEHLVATRLRRHVRSDVDEWDTPMFGAEQTRRVVSPCRGQNNLRAGALENTLEAPQKLGINDVGKLSRIGSFSYSSGHRRYPKK